MMSIFLRRSTNGESALRRCDFILLRLPVKLSTGTKWSALSASVARRAFGVNDVVALKLDVIVFKLTSPASCNAIVVPLTTPGAPARRL